MAGSYRWSSDRLLARAGTAAHRREVRVTLVAYDGMTLQDVVGPSEVLSATPGLEVRFASLHDGACRNDRRQLAVTCDERLEDVVDATDVLVVGGGDLYRHAADERALELLRAASARASWTCSVCTGSELLGAAGLLRGRRATTFWPFLEGLRQHGAEPVRARWVADGDLLTTAGVSAGIDGALWLADQLAGSAAADVAQLAIEYDPAPPRRRGSPDTADPALVADLRARMHAVAERMQAHASSPS